MVTPNDIEAQLQDDFTPEASRQRVDPNANGVLSWGFDEPTSHLRRRQRLWRFLHRATAVVPRRRRKPGDGVGHG
jgi:hypothetical protein